MIDDAEIARRLEALEAALHRAETERSGVVAVKVGYRTYIGLQAVLHQRALARGDRPPAEARAGELQAFGCPVYVVDREEHFEALTRPEQLLEAPLAVSSVVREGRLRFSLFIPDEVFVRATPEQVRGWTRRLWELADRGWTMLEVPDLARLGRRLDLYAPPDDDASGAPME